MKICILTHTFPRNKEDITAAFMKEFADGLTQAGNDVVVVTPFDREFNRKGDMFKIVAYKYIWPDSLHLMGYSRAMQAGTNLKLISYLLLPFMFIGALIALWRSVVKEKVDIINAHWILPNGLVAMFVSLLTGIPYVVTLPGTDAYLAEKYKIFGIVASIIVYFAAGVTSNSPWNLRRVLKLSRAKKLNMIESYPVDVNFFKPDSKLGAQVRKRNGFKQSDFIILAVGRLDNKKGFEYLIRAFSSLARKFKNIYLVIGGTGDLYDKLMGIVHASGLVEKVKFVGNIPRNEINGFYNSCDVFAAPSVVDEKGNVDGGPVVCYESMSCGKLQIVTDILGASLIIKAGLNGYVVPQKNETDLEEAITKTIKNKQMRKKAQKINRQLALDRFSTDKVGEKYTAFFERALSI